MLEQLSQQTVRTKLFVLLLIALASVFLFSMLSLLLVQPLFNMSIAEAANAIYHPEDKLAINALKFMQLINAISLFIIPPIIFAFLVTNNKLHYFNLHKGGPYIIYLIIPAIMIGGMPLINFLAEINSQLKFPAWLAGVEHWMKSSEESAERITKAFLAVEDIKGLVYNLLLIAVIPAIGEELLFRGLLQRLFCEGTNSKHWGIWIAAILFSALHMQFYGFLPRMLMGVLFGYMLIWSGSLWAPIFGHLMNNGVAVLAFYFIQQGTISPEIEHIGEGEGQVLQVLISAVLVFSLLWFYYNLSKTSHNSLKPESQ